MMEFLKNLVLVSLGMALMLGGSYLICGAFVWIALTDIAVARPYIKMIVFWLWVFVWFVKAIVWFMKFDWLFGRKDK